MKDLPRLTLDRVIELGTPDQIYGETLCLIQWYYDYCFAFRLEHPDHKSPAKFPMTLHHQINPEYVYGFKALAPYIPAARQAVADAIALYRAHACAPDKKLIKCVYELCIANRAIGFADGDV